MSVVWVPEDKDYSIVILVIWRKRDSEEQLLLEVHFELEEARLKNMLDILI